MRTCIIIMFSLSFSCLSFAQKQTGKSSFYHNSLKGSRTANGERFDPEEFTAAHRYLSFGTKVLVTNLANNKSVVVRINDRGPFVDDRIIDLTPAAAKKLDFFNHGLTEVHLEALHDETEVTGQLIQEDSLEKKATQIHTQENTPQLKSKTFLNQKATQLIKNN